MHKHSCVNCFIPPHMLKSIAANGTENQKNTAIDTFKVSAQMRGQRQALADFHAATFRVAVGGKERIVYDAKNGSNLPGTVSRRGVTRSHTRMASGRKPVSRLARDGLHSGAWQ